MDEKLVKKYFKVVRKRVDFKSDRTSYQDVISAYTGGKKARYYVAMQKLREVGLLERDGRVSMFVKPDPFPKDDLRTKAPRAIQFRSAKFNLKMAHYLKKFEEDFYNKFESKLGKRVVMKGLNPRRRAELVMDKIERFRKPHFICIDHSRFDSTINPLHLQQTHRIYAKAVGKGIYPIVKAQLKNRGYTKHGIKYQMVGTRCSGDYDTGLGNCIVNIAAIEAVIDGVEADYFLDGDDAVLIVEETDLDRIQLGRFADFGFKTKVQITDKVHQVEFCQSRIIWNRGPIFSRNPLRAISHMMVTKVYYSPRMIARYMRGVGECEEACSAGIPILSEAARKLKYAGSRPIMDNEMKWKMDQSKDMRKEQVTMESRISYWITWGITPAMQIEIESSLSLPFAHHKYHRTRNSEFRYDVESLWKSWTRMAPVGRTSGSGWWVADQCWSSGLCS